VIFIPRPYQHLIRKFALDHERANIFASMGMGKSGATLDTFDTLRLFGEAKRLLVIAPKRVAKNTWPREVEKLKGSFGHLSVATIIGNEDQRVAGARAGADVTTVNYDNLPWLVRRAGTQWPWDMVVCDESTRLKGLRISLQQRKKKDGSLGKEFIQGQGSTRAKALGQVAHRHVRRWMNLTGSPAPNGLVDLWGPMWFVDKGFRLGNSFDAYSRRWFRAPPGSDPMRSQLEPMPFAQKQIEDLIRDVCITVEAKDWFDIKDPIERIIRIELPPAARKQYQEMQKELFTMVRNGSVDEEVEAFNAGSKSNKCLQIASGNVFFDKEGGWAKVHDEKIEALQSIIEETNGAPLLVRYCFRPELERIMKAFPFAKFFDDKRETEDDWNAGKYRMLVTHAASAGHGSNLQDGGNILVDFSSGWNLEEDEQIIERIGPTRQLQSGHDRPVWRYRIVAGDTIEETAVLPRIKSKASVQDALKAAMKVAS
jgi:SNF2 family DNA or RNA helicase